VCKGSGPAGTLGPRRAATNPSRAFSP